jgi:hypothetical protein
MKRPHLFLMFSFSAVCAGCAAAALSLAPVDGNRAGTAAGFVFFASVSAASLALLGATIADARGQLDYR